MSICTTTTQIKICGFSREIDVKFLFNDITEEVIELHDIRITETDSDANWILSDEEIIKFISEQIADEMEEKRTEAAEERRVLYRGKYYGSY